MIKPRLVESVKPFKRSDSQSTSKMFQHSSYVDRKFGKELSSFDNNAENENDHKMVYLDLPKTGRGNHFKEAPALQK